MGMLRSGFLVVALGLSVSACASGPGEDQAIGTAGGAAVGAGIGRAVAATASYGTVAGALGGALVGYAAGTYVNQDMQGQEKHAHAVVQVAENGQPAAWQTARSHGTVVATGAGYSDRSGRTCRPLKQDSDFAGTAVSRDVTACLGTDGTWEVTDYRPELRD